MQAPNWTDFLQCSVCTNRYNTTSLLPISLSCGHTICKKCLTDFMSRVCPYDKTAISPNAEFLPPNSALLWLLKNSGSSGGGGGGGGVGDEEEVDTEGEIGDFSLLNLSAENLESFKNSRNSIRKVAFYLQPLVDTSGNPVNHYLTRPMLKKLVTVISCQFIETDGRARVLRAARSITDRTVTELLVMHQNQQQISTLLWSAIRNRGCQFLGPVMQEEALKLILKVLESGAFLSRKNIVLYVVQQLQHQDFTQASKTSVGHVVQLLYRASCFNVEKRDEDSSRMQLKEEFRTYEALRREHDAQIIRVAMESGLRISPEQWSALLYGDQKHKSDMQSIIDKLLSLGIATSGLSELIVAIRRSQDQHNLLEKIVPHLEKLLRVDINIDKSSEEVNQWSFFSEAMAALVAMLHEYSSFMRLHMQDSQSGPNPSQIQSGRYKTGLCPNLSRPGGCPKGEKCTYAHTEEERDKYRSMARGAKTRSRELGKPVSGPQPIPSRSGGNRWSGDITKLDSSPFSSLTSYDGLATFSSGGGATVAYPTTGGGAVGVEGYSTEYSTVPTAVGGGTPIVLQQVMRQTPSLTSDPSISLIGAQPQLVAYHNPHHSGQLTISRDQLQAVYDSQHIEPTYYRRSDSVSDEYSLVGVATNQGRYSTAAQAPLHPGYLTTGPPSALDSIKQVHADIKRNVTATNLSSANERGQNHYPPPTSVTHLSYQGTGGGGGGGGGGYETYTSGGARGRPGVGSMNDTYSQDTLVPPPVVDQQIHHHDNPADHTSQGEQLIDSPSVYQLASTNSGSGGGGGVDKGEEGREEPEVLTQPMSQLQLKNPAYYDTTPYSSTVGGVSSMASYTQSSDSFPLYSTTSSSSSSSTSLQTRPQDPSQHNTHYSTAPGGSGGDEARGLAEIEAMKERIRQLESQLATQHQSRISQPQPPPPPSGPVHQPSVPSGVMYGSGSTGDSYSVANQYTPQLQQVQVFPTATAHQPTFYTPSPATPTYQLTNWSGPQYSGELTASLQTVPGPGSGNYVFHQASQAPPTHQNVRRGVYVQQQQPLTQDLFNKDHMLAMYLQIQEQSKPTQQQAHHHQLPHSFPPPPPPPHQPPAPPTPAVAGGSAQVGYAGGGGGGAQLGYHHHHHQTNHYIPSVGAQYIMRPF